MSTICLMVTCMHRKRSTSTAAALFLRGPIEVDYTGTHDLSLKNDGHLGTLLWLGDEWKMLTRQSTRRDKSPASV
jgi:hypothetical protein